MTAATSLCASTQFLDTFPFINSTYFTYELNNDLLLQNNSLCFSSSSEEEQHHWLLLLVPDELTKIQKLKQLILTL